ncbi:hypothetical protein TNIN_357031 [Trichonephila inaurata madagascariensis]|uniref:Uncharacterized protein n=1 Tax=Trichonephila inaurata madagascariensis TaxID=2747483 RepID=A0A8X6XRU4_9ARAC|nr:hypothetical protein TNIN_357031 [Trichonephila inaurata madagascariensis]
MSWVIFSGRNQVGFDVFSIRLAWGGEFKVAVIFTLSGLRISPSGRTSRICWGIGRFMKWVAKGITGRERVSRLPLAEVLLVYPETRSMPYEIGGRPHRVQGRSVEK